MVSIVTIASVILVAVVGAIAYLAIRYVSLGASRAINDLEGSIQKIRDLSDPRVSLMIRQIWGDRFLQFRSEEYGDVGRTLELWLPKMGWSAGFYPWIVKKCIEMGLPRREFVDDAGNEFVVISFGENCAVAAKFAADILVDIFEMRVDEKVKVRIDLHRSTSARN